MDNVQDKKFSGVTIAGTVIALFFSAVVGYFNVGVFYLFGIPFVGLLAGLIIVWFSRTSVNRKILISLSPFPVIVVTYLLFLQMNEAMPEIFLLPAGFRNEFVVFYDEPCGVEPTFEDGHRLYDIPESGVLIAKFKSNGGFLDRTFYFVDQEGTRSEFPAFDFQNFETELKEWSYTHKTPVEDFSRQTVGAFWAYGSDTSRISHNSTGYIVSSYQDFEATDKARWKKRKDFADMATKLLRECRQ